MRYFFLITAILGLIIPYAYFVPFLAENGLNIPLFIQQMFSNRIAGFFSWDVILSSVVFWGFLFYEGRRLAMKNLWVYILLNLLVGLSFAFPVFLYVREGNLRAQRSVY